MWLLVLIIFSVLIGRRYFSRLSGSELLWMLLCVTPSVIWWIRVWRSHAKLHGAYLSSRPSEKEDRIQLDLILTESADLEMTGLNMTLFVLMSALMVFSTVLAR
jgi:hypothetical protein